MELYENIEAIFEILVRYSALAMEITGVLIIVVAAAKSIVHLFTKKENVRIELGEGITLALEFKLGGEVLKTVIVHQWGELAVLGAIIVLRTAMTLLLHWEISAEKKAMLPRT